MWDWGRGEFVKSLQAHTCLFHIISFSPLVFLEATVLTFLKVQKVAPPPASVWLVGTMLVAASLLLLLVKVARVHFVFRELCCW